METDYVALAVYLGIKGNDQARYHFGHIIQQKVHQ